MPKEVTPRLPSSHIHSQFHQIYTAQSVGGDSDTDKSSVAMHLSKNCYSVFTGLTQTRGSGCFTGRRGAKSGKISVHIAKPVQSRPA